jgi:uncharacterized membrane protein YdfJ with MMPL/SSD domain
MASLTAIALIMALIADLTLLPALLIALDKDTPSEAAEHAANDGPETPAMQPTS